MQIHTITNAALALVKELQIEREWLISTGQAMQKELVTAREQILKLQIEAKEAEEEAVVAEVAAELAGER